MFVGIYENISRLYRMIRRCGIVMTPCILSFTETVHNRTVVAERTNFHYTLYCNVNTTYI